MKFGINHAVSTVQKYMLKSGAPRKPSQSWQLFLKNHAKGIAACDFFTEITCFFQIIYVFVVMDLKSREVIHFNITKAPSLPWIKQQIREISMRNKSPRFLIHDNAESFGQYKIRRRIPCTDDNQRPLSFRSHFDYWLLKIMKIKGIPTPYGAPNANAFCERLVRTVRQECLNHMIIFNEQHLYKVLKEYFGWYHHARFHQGLQGIPDPYPEIQKPKPDKGKLVALPVLNGLHHDYRLAA